MEKLTFEETIKELEDILDDLEKNSDKYSETEIASKLDKAEELKASCKELLKSEKEEIIKTAKENGVSLDEIGMSEDEDEEDDEDYEDDEDEDEDDEDYEDEDEDEKK